MRRRRAQGYQFMLEEPEPEAEPEPQTHVESIQQIRRRLVNEKTPLLQGHGQRGSSAQIHDDQTHSEATWRPVSDAFGAQRC